MTAEQKLEAFEALMNEASGAIADMAETIKAGQGTHDEIAATLADMAAALESRKPLDDLIAAVKALRIQPAVNVKNEITVSPTPIQNIVQPAEIHFMPAPESRGATWEIRIPSHFNGPDRVMTIKRTK